RSAADLALPMVAISLVHRQGYFRQRLDDHGNQSEEPEAWLPEHQLRLTEGTTSVTIEGRAVHLRAWRYDIIGMSGHCVPVYLLDADLPVNSVWDRTLTDTLYGGDSRYRMCQEAVLGLDGISMLRSLGLHHVESYHLNEGHSALLTLPSSKNNSTPPLTGLPFLHRELQVLPPGIDQHVQVIVMLRRTV